MNCQIYSKTVNSLEINYSKLQPSINLAFSFQKQELYTWTSHTTSATLLILNRSHKTSKTGKTTSIMKLNMPNRSQTSLMILKNNVISLLLKESPFHKPKRIKPPLDFNHKRFKNKITVSNFLIFTFKIKSYKANISKNNPL